jgi:hypothetical protein
MHDMAQRSSGDWLHLGFGVSQSPMSRRYSDLVFLAIGGHSRRLPVLPLPQVLCPLCIDYPF